MSELGEILWEYNDLAPQGIIRDIILLNDETFYVFGRGDNSCDYGGSGFMFKFDEDGNVLMSSTFDDQIIDPVAVDTFPNGDFIIIDNYSLQRRTRSNEEVWEYYVNTNFDIQDFSDIKTIGNDLLMVGELNDSDCSLLFVENDDAPPLYQTFCRFELDTLRKISYTDNGTYHFLSKSRYYAGKDGNIWTVSNTFPDANFIQIEANAGFVYILDTRDNKILIYENLEVLPSVLSVIDTLHLNLSPNDVPVSFSVTDNNKILLLGQERSTHKITIPPYSDSLSQSSTFLKEYRLGEDNEFLNYDAGVVDILSTNAPTFSTSFCNLSECENLVDIEYTDLEVTIFNYGDHPINSINLNARYPSCSYCDGICYGTQTYTRFYENLNLAPQQSLPLSFGDLLIKQQNADDELELCFWTSVPENKTDKNQENDLFCKLSSLVVANQEISDEQIDLVFIPNTNKIRIDNLNQERLNGSLEVFDLFGKRILHQKIATNEATLFLPFEYALNLYVMIYKDQEFIYTRKFINF